MLHSTNNSRCINSLCADTTKPVFFFFFAIHRKISFHLNVKVNIRVQQVVTLRLWFWKKLKFPMNNFAFQLCVISDKKPLEIDPRMNMISCPDGRQLLMIMKTTKKDAGLYECVASNALASVSSSCVVSLARKFETRSKWGTESLIKERE